MAKKTYISSEKAVPAVPRSKRLRETMSAPVSSAQVRTIMQDNPTSGGGVGHSHSNMATLNRLGLANDETAYLWIADRIGDGQQKVRAGYADVAGDIADNSPLYNKFLRKDQADVASGEITFVHGLTTQDMAKIADDMGTPVFVDDFAGEGWRIDADGNLTIENLTVRSTMRVFELLVQQVKATGGEIIVSPANGRIKAVDEEEGGGTGGFPMAFPVTFPQTQGDMYVCTIDDGDNESGSFSYGNMFHVGDLVRCQRWNKNLNTIHSYWVCVAKVEGNDIYLPKTQFASGTAPEVGDELVLMGSASDTTRQGAISISATNDGHPRITVLNGISTPSLAGRTRLVLGDLSGISDPDFSGDSAISGYGLYSDNVFLKGRLALSDGTLISSELTDIKSGKIHLSGETTVDSNFNAQSIETIPDPPTITIDGETVVNQAKIRIHGSILEAFGAFGQRNIRFGVDEAGYSVMSYYDNDGTLLYDLGPDGIKYVDVVNAQFILTTFYTDLRTDTTDDQHSVTFYVFYPKRLNGEIVADAVYADTAEIARSANGKWFTGTPIADNGDLTNLATRLLPVRLATDAILNLQDTLIEASSENECKEKVKTEYNLTDEDLAKYGTISFAGTSDGEFWLLNQPVYVQLTRSFLQGRMTTKYIIWQ